jgi:hypothetical protein
VSNYHLALSIVVLGCAATPPPAVAPDEAHRAAPAGGSAPEATAAEAAVSSSAPAPQPGATVPSSPDDECHGFIDESLQHQLAGRAAQVRFCYEKLLRREPQREGRLMVTVRLSETATIDRARITLDELADPETADCALASFKEPLNGTVAGGCAIVNVPLRFMIKKPEPQVTP